MKGTPRTALTVIVAALALMLAAGTGATASLMISGKQIKDNSVTSQDIKNKSLKVKDLSTKAQAKLKGRTGATGATGERGPAGPAGPAGSSGPQGIQGLIGLPGLSGFEVVTNTVPIGSLLNSTDFVTATCPAGKKAISATAGYAAPLSGLLSQVVRQGDSAFKATGLNVLGTITSQVLTLDVVCANVPG